MQNKYTFRLALNTSLIVINSRSELLDAAAQRALWGNLLGTGQQRINTGEVELQFGAETTWTRDRLWYILLKCWAALKGSKTRDQTAERQRKEHRVSSSTDRRQGGREAKSSRYRSKTVFFAHLPNKFHWEAFTFWQEIFFFQSFRGSNKRFGAANNLVTRADTKICGVQSSVWNLWQSHNNMSIVETQQFVSTHIAPYIFIRHRHCVCSLQLASHHLCFLVALPSFGNLLQHKNSSHPLWVALIFLQNGMHFIS